MITCEVTAMSSVHIALVVSDHLGVIMVDCDYIKERPMCKGPIDCKKRKGVRDRRP